MRQAHPAGGHDPPADIDLDEMGTEVCLACLEQLLAQDDIALTNADHIAVKDADVVRLVPFCDEGEEVELGADSSAASTDGLLECDLNSGEV